MQSPRILCCRTPASLPEGNVKVIIIKPPFVIDVRWKQRKKSDVLVNHLKDQDSYLIIKNAAFPAPKGPFLSVLGDQTWDLLFSSPKSVTFPASELRFDVCALSEPQGSKCGTETQLKSKSEAAPLQN